MQGASVQAVGSFSRAGSLGSTSFAGARESRCKGRAVIPVVAALLWALPGAGLAQVGDRQGPPAPEEDGEIQRITLIRLGGSFPVDRGEGKVIPLWVVGHFDRGFQETRLSLSAWIKTTRQEVTLELPVTDEFRVGVELRGEVLSADDAVFRYDDGEFVEDRVFEAHTVGAAIFAQYKTSAGLRARLRYGARRYFFDETRQTDSAYRVPLENTTHGVRGEIGFARERTWQDGEIRDGLSAGVFSEYERRDAWGGWGDEPSTLRRFRDGQDYWRYGAKFGGHLRLFRHHGFGIDLAARFGEDLDFLSEYTVGSQFSLQRVVGYYYAEFRTSRVLVGNIRYGANLWEGARGTLILDGAALRVTGDWEWITGVGVALRQKIWLGIPVTAQYGYGIDGKRNGSRGGHEIYLSITAAF